ncbi:SusC/RagA family TonB-linked outer membrane protein [Chitinophaga sp. GCM10012297]|uniref:TonB-dependent receptor n=1 Tax=Chitinophaga chungangae TaxID=2821488 RepID=A0ABS3YIE1_9BACT|nr:TonB-dependent receptor [Chitinophaga chungangae]MBO9154451.1 TonB-dependent receptor [Chitinophaga chungangae]
MVTISLKNEPLEAGFQKIEQQTGFRFAYVELLLSPYRHWNLPAGTRSVEETLDLLLNNTPLVYKVNRNSIAILRRKNETDSSCTIRGRVFSEEGTPLPGATIIIKNSGRGTTTDTAGAFALEQVTLPAVLQARMVGYVAQEAALKEKRTAPVFITLENDTRSLEQVVVVGYNTQKKRNIISAITTVPGTEIQKAPTLNISNALAGRVPGILATTTSGRPGIGAYFRIRGKVSLNEPGPLVVIDGIVRNDEYGNINPYEVETVSVLKDAAAASVYGARAAGGVILITTKRGTAGKPVVTWNGSTGTESPTQYPRLMNAYEYATLWNQANLNAGYDPRNPAQAGRFYSARQLEDFRSGKAGTDWWKTVFSKRGALSQQNISIRGGSENIRYFGMLGTAYQKGLWDAYNFRRINLRSNVDARINATLTAGLNLEARRSTTRAAGLDAYNIFEHTVQSPPVIPAYTASGRFYDAMIPHPLADIRESGENTQRDEVFQGTIFFEQQLPFITKGLSVKGTAAIVRRQYFQKWWRTPYLLYSEDGQGNITGVRSIGIGDQVNTSLFQESRQFTNNTYNISLNYAKTAGKNELSALALYEEIGQNSDYFNASRREFPTNSQDYFYASGPGQQTIDGRSAIDDARRSLVGIVNFTYNNRYLVNATVRYDGSFRFPPGKRWGLFPSVSAGWRLSEEPFLRDAVFFSDLKLRASAGITGNDNVGAYQYLNEYFFSQGQVPGSFPPFYAPVLDNEPAIVLYNGVYANRNITWEKLRTANIGVDATVLKGRLELNFDYFFRTTTDMLWDRARSVPATFGRRLPKENYAEMKSNGWELVLHYNGHTRALQYNVGIQGTFAANEITRIDDPENGPSWEKRQGRPIGFQVGYRAAGIFRSEAEVEQWYGGMQFGQRQSPGDIRYVDVNGDGQITDQDQDVIGPYDILPQLTYGISGGLRWKNLDMDFLFQGAARRSLMLSMEAITLFRGGRYNSFAYLMDAWSPGNEDAKYPRAAIDASFNNNRYSTFWLRDASYLRLKTVNIGYTFNWPWLKKNNGKLRVYAAGANLLTWSPFREFDPEAENGVGYYYPQMRNFTVGAGLSF